MSPASTVAHRIEDYAMIGSTHSAALIHRDGTIQWLCMPRFDSEAIFASLLGTPDNGEWAVRATDPAARIARRYVPDTMVLETTIDTPTGRAVVLDFMPTPVDGDLHELVRIIRGVEGHVDFAAELRLRFNYGEWIPWVERREGAIFAFAGPDAIRLSSSVDLSNANFSTTSDFTIVAGQSVATTLEWFPSHKIPPLPRDPYALLRHTEAQGRLWAAQCTYDGPYAAVVRRSLMTLKALTYHPTGGIVAAPTTSLPEDPGGSRNWDYRYCWLRDAVWTLHALTVSGYMEEASAWRWWLMRATAGAPDGLQVMYGLHGERRLTETTLDHLAGYENSRPVRIGNAAHEQLQLDVYGSLLGAFDAARRDGLADMDAVWPLQCAIAERLLVLWRQPDCSLWEVRGPKQHFVYSKMMCWFAFDRMIASAVDFGLDGPVETWRAAREEIHAEVCEKGFDAASNSFMQYYGADRVDASLLQIPLLGFLPADDPRVQGTIARIEKELLHDNVVYRYLPEGVAADGLEGREGAFLACSFWLCDAYIMSHRVEEARVLFERLLSYGNDLGLFAEEYDPVARRQLGNFPQAFSHFALVHTAHMLAGGVIDASGQRRRKK
ncbi:glycoside hydrolase family 15 protein [Gluconacetobacter entanii]|uniref:Glycoside hydrolase family 15 protein n=1 Tax=Gluconacetobacter entanii TaxID=108528 RepID=A0ABT3KAM0_9PROT|nr:glycoside hydrolase family 15 protein [Gluconacetobacter entanii]MBE7618084.1 glycoside hydrolase family 15 protein [Komagataeibacter sp. FXV2]MCE2577730.1 glycoside hydrolase family 15 protein [Komagataeibacter sp. FNDCR1]MCW4592146.1 glycoside hydrolase family 15 protein [Gluconacetobacter entanii]MCW4595845.1 glycoside hydrolase family 15 protein [Gluconacetobacter entanii]NPC87361.1 glycoside hydrolase family 15 protein [Gluconacetobacter entanii]